VGRRITGVAAAIVAGFGAAGLASAATADKEQIHLTAAGQAAARAVVIRKADLGTAAGWTGGTKKPTESPSPKCSGYEPKQSDLVKIGDAESEWKNGPLTLDSEAQVLRTAAMVRLDWKRSVLDPHVVPCLRQVFAKALPPNTKVVSVRRVSFPVLATYSRAYRLVADITTGTTKVRMFSDIVLVGRGRTEVTLTVTAPYVGVQSVQAAEVRLASLMLARVRT
jgi:hypothetical protein